MSIQSSLPPEFPPVQAADEDGLLLIGGRLNADWLLAAYRRGIFPWPIVFRQHSILAWFSPDPRAVLTFQSFHVSRSLRRRLRVHPYQLTCNQQFAAVMQGCAAPRSVDSGTWITPEMCRAYLGLHQSGHAHSVEVWQDSQLIGGVYGVAVGGVFAAESMFHRRTDASKIALVYLVSHLQARGFGLIDIQQATPHTVRFGAIEISRDQYLDQLTLYRDRDVSFGNQLEGDPRAW